MKQYIVTLKIEGDISYGTLLDLLKENVEMKVKVFGPTVEIVEVQEMPTAAERLQLKQDTEIQKYCQCEADWTDGARYCQVCHLERIWETKLELKIGDSL